MTLELVCENIFSSSWECKKIYTPLWAVLWVLINFWWWWAWLGSCCGIYETQGRARCCSNAAHTTVEKSYSNAAQPSYQLQICSFNPLCQKCTVQKCTRGKYTDILPLLPLLCSSAFDLWNATDSMHCNALCYNNSQAHHIWRKPPNLQMQYKDLYPGQLHIIVQSPE